MSMFDNDKNMKIILIISNEILILENVFDKNKIF